MSNNARSIVKGVRAGQTLTGENGESRKRELQSEETLYKQEEEEKEEETNSHSTESIDNIDNDPAEDILPFPVGEISHFFQQATFHTHLDDDAPIYLSAVLEYVTTKIIKLAGNAARDSHDTYIAPRHITLVVKNDEALDELFGDVSIPKKSIAKGTFPTCIYRVLKKVQPDLGISENGMQLMNKYVADVFGLITSEVNQHDYKNKENTISLLEMQLAVSTTLPFGLVEEATSEGNKAVLHDSSTIESGYIRGQALSSASPSSIQDHDGLFRIEGAKVKETLSQDSVVVFAVIGALALISITLRRKLGRR